MSPDAPRTGMSLTVKLLVAALALGVLVYLVVVFLGKDSGSLQPYDGFN